MAKAPKPTPRGKKPVAVLIGTAAAPLSVEIRISDPEYAVDVLTDDIKNQRVWTVGDADAQGWKKLVYSADGPTGDPWQIGKIRITFNPDTIDPHFHNLSNVTLKRSE